MTQNIYDNPDFFKGYSQLPRSIHGLEGAPEWPALRALLPDIHGLRVLDLGCGFGWFCRWAQEHGARSILGVDVSEKMLDRATAMTRSPKITYQKADLEQFAIAEDSFDLVYSSLAFHYLTHLERLMSEIYRALIPGGKLVFSVEHPIYTAPVHPGWSIDEKGRKTWPVESYSLEGPRTTDWLARGVIKQHRTIATYLNLLIGLGYRLSQIEEWQPTQEQLTSSPSLEEERHRPIFLLVSAGKEIP